MIPARWSLFFGVLRCSSSRPTMPTRVTTGLMSSGAHDRSGRLDPSSYSWYHSDSLRAGCPIRSTAGCEDTKSHNRYYLSPRLTISYQTVY
ncbi:hypothetical protein PR003_g26411 [Phytophthora rubi]|uniref:Uncharacterized protein n=1 Tax=Phytophthora rubi TaxID=129364 RepID=A0A6A4C8Z5_9STRA|nr:hypothetical protein PR003_g26411 [Phytophthora rubi]